MIDLTRRNFLASVAMTGLAARGAMAIGPISRPGKQRIRLSLAAYSVRELLTAKPGTPGAMDLPAFISWAAGLDVDAVELTSYYFPNAVTPQYLSDIKRQCHVAGLDISGGAIRNNFTLPDGPALDAQMAYTRTWIDNYAALGVGVIRVFAGIPPKGTSEEEGIARAVKNMRVACEYASQRGVILGLENHDYLTELDRLVEIVKQIDSPYFGVNFDSGNVKAEDPYAALKKIAPYAVNAQAKVLMPTKGGGKEPTDLARVVAILREVGYSGYIALEYEAKEDPLVAVPRYLEQLRKALATTSQ